MTTDLTFVERTTLLVLMAESRPVKLAELKELGSSISTAKRNHLVALGLIDAKETASALVLELTDGGRERATAERAPHLTPAEQDTLRVLMAESRPVKLAELKELGSSLSKPKRDHLFALELIEVKKAGRGFVLELTDGGRERATAERAPHLTPAEQDTLRVLMAESRPVKLAELKELCSSLSKPKRDHLVALELIEVKKAGRGFVLELTDSGWVRATEEFGAAPADAQGGGKVLYTLLRAMRRYFDRAGIQPNEVFLPAQINSASTEPTSPERVKGRDGVDLPPVPPVKVADVETRIRSAHNRLARDPKSFVSLTRLRAELADLDRNAVDEVLSSLYREQKINLIPEANQKTLTDEDRSAAMHIGGQNRHMVTIK